MVGAILAWMTDHDRVQEIVLRSQHAMLILRTAAGELRGRPANVVHHEDDPTLWLIARCDAATSAAVARDPAVDVTFQRGDAFVSISGKAEIIRDRVLLRLLWQDGWRPSFADGPDDADLVLLQITPTKSDLWDLSARRDAASVMPAESFVVLA